MLRLRHDRQIVDLASGRYTIGRATDCQISLDDALVSRQHAALVVVDDEVSVEDLGSRNGVRVNGERISNVTQLFPGDVVKIGAQELAILPGADTAPASLAAVATQRGDAFGVLGALADKALAMGRGEEAERLLASHLEAIGRSIEGGKAMEEDTVDTAARYACQLARLTRKGSWIDYVFRVFTGTARVCPADVTEELYEVLRVVDQVDTAKLRSYLDTLRPLSRELGPAQRFQLKRLEGLVRIAALK